MPKMGRAPEKGFVRSLRYEIRRRRKKRARLSEFPRRLGETLHSTCARGKNGVPGSLEVPQWVDITSKRQQNNRLLGLLLFENIDNI